MDQFPISIFAKNKARKLIDKLQGDSIETVQDVLNHEDELINFAFLNKPDIFNQEDVDLIISKSHQANKNYQAYFNDFFSSNTYQIPLRIPIPLVNIGPSRLKNKLSTAIIDELNACIAIGEVTQIYGLPGRGKTALCKTLIVNHLLMNEYINVNTHILYVDFEGGFDIQRFKNILEENIMSRLKLTKKEINDLIQQLLKRMLYIRILDSLEYEQFMNKLKSIVKKEPKISMIVLDSFTTPFRNLNEQYSINKIINEASLKLVKIANKFNICVLYTNTISSASQHVLKESFGDILSPNCHTKICLDKLKPANILKVEKTIMYASQIIEKPIRFMITKNGVELFGE